MSPSSESNDATVMKLAVLISGSGRTLKNFIDLAAGDELPVDIRLVVSSSAKAGGLAFAESAGIPTRIIRRGEFPAGTPGDVPYGDAIFAACRDAGVDYVAMAGFLKLAPVPNDFLGRVINIHPALIPSFCGHGMYGSHVHQAVLDAGVKVTGCTVHFVDNHYDQGPIIWQQPVPVFADDTVPSLADRVFEAEKEAYPHVLRLLAASRIRLEGRRAVITTSHGREESPREPGSFDSTGR
jgi:phosphoribosylglycinamide formyltransferase 1